nr:11388_t:CDS:2 [Entrophospora candida]
MFESPGDRECERGTEIIAWEGKIRLVASIIAAPQSNLSITYPPKIVDIKEILVNFDDLQKGINVYKYPKGYVWITSFRS